MDFVGSLLAGALGGLAVVVGERLLFRARSTWGNARQSWQFLVSKWDQWRAGALRCPNCSRRKAQLDDPPRKEYWNPEESHYMVMLNLHCLYCGHEWRELIDRKEPPA